MGGGEFFLAGCAVMAALVIGERGDPGAIFVMGFGIGFAWMGRRARRDVERTIEALKKGDRCKG